jgi:hypothetical protein
LLAAALDLAPLEARLATQSFPFGAPAEIPGAMKSPDRRARRRGGMPGGSGRTSKFT